MKFEREEEESYGEHRTEGYGREERREESYGGSYNQRQEPYGKRQEREEYNTTSYSRREEPSYGERSYGDTGVEESFQNLNVREVLSYQVHYLILVPP